MHSRMHKENVGSSLHGREYSRQRRSSGELSALINPASLSRIIFKINRSLGAPQRELAISPQFSCNRQWYRCLQSSPANLGPDYAGDSFSPSNDLPANSRPSSSRSAQPSWMRMAQHDIPRCCSFVDIQREGRMDRWIWCNRPDCR